MNKALEMIEASWLFGVPGNRIDAVINQQSIVHALAELTDGSFIAQMSVPDMRLAIRYALTYPNRLPGTVGKTSLSKLATLTFEEVDYNRFPALNLARIALKASGSMPAVLNASNEVAVESFLAGKISFPQIWQVVEESMNQHNVIPQRAIEDMIEVDKVCRIKANEIIAKLTK
jgi:1-deoxy-D-xylulose-5-phosphate reductoisomerase